MAYASALPWRNGNIAEKFMASATIARPLNLVSEPCLLGRPRNRCARLGPNTAIYLWPSATRRPDRTRSSQAGAHEEINCPLCTESTPPVHRDLDSSSVEVGRIPASCPTLVLPSSSTTRRRHSRPHHVLDRQGHGIPTRNDARSNARPWVKYMRSNQTRRSNSNHCLSAYGESIRSERIKARDLECANDGKTLRRFAIWRPGLLHTSAALTLHANCTCCYAATQIVCSPRVQSAQQIILK